MLGVRQSMIDDATVSSLIRRRLMIKVMAGTRMTQLRLMLHLF